MVYKTIKVAKEIMEPHRYCDICGNEININLACNTARCSYCGRDLCEDCIGNEEDTSGDYRFVFCKDCWNIGESYRPEIDELHTKINELYEEWQGKCKENSIE